MSVLNVIISSNVIVLVVVSYDFVTLHHSCFDVFCHSLWFGCCVAQVPANQSSHDARTVSMVVLAMRLGSKCKVIGSISALNVATICNVAVVAVAHLGTCINRAAPASRSVEDLTYGGSTTNRSALNFVSILKTSSRPLESWSGKRGTFSGGGDEQGPRIVKRKLGAAS